MQTSFTSLSAYPAKADFDKVRMKAGARYVGRDDLNDADSQANNRVSVFLL